MWRARLAAIAVLPQRLPAPMTLMDGFSSTLSRGGGQNSQSAAR